MKKIIIVILVIIAGIISLYIYNVFQNSEVKKQILSKLELSMNQKQTLVEMGELSFEYDSLVIMGPYCSPEFVEENLNIQIPFTPLEIDEYEVWFVFLKQSKFFKKVVFNVNELRVKVNPLRVFDKNYKFKLSKPHGYYLTDTTTKTPFCVIRKLN